MNGIQIAMVALFAVVYILQLVSILAGKEKLRWATKLMLMPVLLVAMIVITGKAPWLLVGGIVFGFLGDLLLLFEKWKYSILTGILAFSIGHGFYAIALAQGINYPSTPWIIFAVIFHIIGIIGGIRIILPMVKESHPKMKIPVSCYMVIICLMGVFAMMRFLGAPSLQTGITVAGAICFIISDFTLSFDLFKEKSRITYFVVMLFYPLAQALIVAGLTWQIVA